MHADRPGDRPRLLYWYRTAPGIVQGRPPLDEDAIRTIEEQHPDIDFDWPALLALAAAMTPEEEAAPRPQQQQRQGKRQRGREQRPPQTPREAQQQPQSQETVAVPESADVVKPEEDELEAEAPSAAIEIPPPRNLLVEELAGREIGSRLRARYAEIIARIQQLDVDGSVKDTWFTRAETIDPETWMTPEQVLEGVRNADSLYEKLKSDLGSA